MTGTPQRSILAVLDGEGYVHFETGFANNVNIPYAKLWKRLTLPRAWGALKLWDINAK